MRVLKAVKCDALAAYVNVVVFPAEHMVTERSIPAECSGGDLDGDMFACIWDPALVPPREHESFDYGSLTRLGAGEAPLSIAESISLGMRNASLGKIARLHLALCDMLPKGARVGPNNNYCRYRSVFINKRSILTSSYHRLSHVISSKTSSNHVAVIISLALREG